MISVMNIRVKFPDFYLKDVSFSLGPKDIFALLGPTGSGKSVILEAIMGLISLDSGKIKIDQKDISNLPPESRNLGLVYQDHALFPHMSVQENILYGIRYHNIPENVCQSRFNMLADKLKLEKILHRRPNTLSGGEKQRTALARALMLKPRALLLDEPLSALEPAFRDEIRQLLKNLHAELQIPFILVSHSFPEVHFLANKGAVLYNGQIQQKGDLDSLFERPLSSFVAFFVGMKNVFTCQISNSQAKVGQAALKVNGQARPEHTHLAIRPEEINYLSSSSRMDYENILQGRIKELECRGFYFRVGIEVLDFELQAYWTRQVIRENSLTLGQKINIGFFAQSVHTFANQGQSH